MLRQYQGYATFGTDPDNAVTVRHACEHEVTYEYGGTAPEYAPLRAAWAAKQATTVYPDCAVMADLLPVDTDLPMSGDILVMAAGAGEGRLTMQDGKVVFVCDKTKIVEGGYDEMPPAPQTGHRRSVSWKYRTRLFRPIDASYIHRLDGCAYSAAEEAWLEEYFTRGHVDGPFKRYAPGRSFSTGSQIRNAEKRLGRKIPLTAPCR